MFKCEDERYNLDLNIIKYKAILKYLEETYALTDEIEREQRLNSILKSNVIRPKFHFLILIFLEFVVTNFIENG